MFNLPFTLYAHKQLGPMSLPETLNSLTSAKSYGLAKIQLALNSLNRHFQLTAGEITLDTLGGPLCFGQIYNSGQGSWHLRCLSQLRATTHQCIVLTKEDGTELHFRAQAQQATLFLPPKDCADPAARITQLDDGSYVLISGDKEDRAHFDHRFRLVSKKLGIAAVAQEFAYDDKGRVETVTVGENCYAFVYGERDCKVYKSTKQRRKDELLVSFIYQDQTCTQLVKTVIGSGDKAYTVTIENTDEQLTVSQQDGNQLHLGKNQDDPKQLSRFSEGDNPVTYALSNTINHFGLLLQIECVGAELNLDSAMQARGWSIQHEQFERLYSIISNTASEASLSSQQQWFSFNQQGQLETLTYPGGEQLKLAYTDEGRIEQLTITDKYSKVISNKHYYYNKNGSLIRLSRYLNAENAADKQALSTHYVYGKESGRKPRFIIHPDGGVIEHCYESGLVKSTRQYYTHYKLIALLADNQSISLATMEQWASEVDKSQSQLTEYDYNKAGQVRRETHYSRLGVNGLGQDSDSIQKEHQWSSTGERQELRVKGLGLDEVLQKITRTLLDLPSTETDALGQELVNHYKLSDAGMVHGIDLANGLKKTLTMNTQGRLIESLELSESDGCSRHIIIEHDPFERKQYQVNRDGSHTIYLYDGEGELAYEWHSSGRLNCSSSDLI